jgi:hypothetical protein
MGVHTNSAANWRVCAEVIEMRKILLILIMLVAINIAYAVPQIPKQVYGNIIPDLPANYAMSFKIGGVEYETGRAYTTYGYDPLVLVPVDDPATPGKEGYVGGDVVFVYINNVKVAEHTYPASVNKIDITLTQAQVNEITGAQPRIPAPSGGGGGALPGCFERWNCTDWSPCGIEGIQTRSCVDTGTCNRPDKIEEQVCTYVPSGIIEGELPAETVTEGEYVGFEEPGGRGLLVLLLVVIVAGGLGFVFYEWERSRKSLTKEKTGKKLEDQSLQRLKSYVQMTLGEGYTKPQIRQALQKEGWSQDIINQVLK